jgi:hypothetical protein
MTQTKSATDAIETGSTAMRALAVGAFALGAAAIGAIAVGAMAIGRLRILEARIEKLSIVTIVPLAAECVTPAKAVMNIWRATLQDRSVVLLVHSQKVL